MSQGLTFNHLRSLSRTSTKKSAGSKEIPVCLWTQSNWSSQILFFFALRKKKIFVPYIGSLDVNNCLKLAQSHMPWVFIQSICNIKGLIPTIRAERKKTIQSYREAESDEHRNPIYSCLCSVPASQGYSYTWLSAMWWEGTVCFLRVFGCN